MKKLLSLILAFLLIVVSCNKKESREVLPTDNLLYVRSHEVNVLIRKYNAFENNFVKAFKSDDRGLLKLYSDSTNHYDKLLFSNAILSKLTAEEKVKYNAQINEIRLEKINQLNSREKQSEKGKDSLTALNN